MLEARTHLTQWLEQTRDRPDHQAVKQPPLLNNQPPQLHKKERLVDKKEPLTDKQPSLTAKRTVPPMERINPRLADPPLIDIKSLEYL